MVSYDKKTLERMINGTLSWDELRVIISGNKDADRFDKILDILQDNVAWPEKIILPLHEHLYIVLKDNHRIVKCDCGHYPKDHYAREGWCDECGCTWYYPNYRYILRKKKENKK